LAAADRGVKCNVYDEVRILAADFFVDQFDVPKLMALEKAYKAISDQEKLKIFGTDVLDSRGKAYEFEALFLKSIVQVNRWGLLKQLASGCCATAFTCRHIVEFVDNTFATIDDRLAVGPVRQALDPETEIPGLGQGNAASQLNTPRVYRAELSPASPAPVAVDSVQKGEGEESKSEGG
jgi:hypothetical protein